MKTKILKTMEKVKGDYSLSGYRFICDGVEYLYDNFNTSVCELYKIIGDMHNVDRCNVERCIRHFIERAVIHGDTQFIKDITNYDTNKGKPTNSQFIYGVLEYIRREHI